MTMLMSIGKSIEMLVNSETDIYQCVIFADFFADLVRYLVIVLGSGCAGLLFVVLMAGVIGILGWFKKKEEPRSASHMEKIAVSNSGLVCFE